MAEDGTKSDFNEAFSFLGRINSLFLASHDARIKEDLKGYWNYVFAVYLELASEMDDTQRSRLSQQLRLLGKAVSQLRADRMGRIIYMDDLYWQLASIDEELRKLFDDKGFKTRRSESAGESFK